MPDKTRFILNARPLSRRELFIIWLPFFGWFRRGRRRLAGIEFQVIRRGRGGRRYLLIHGDEETAREVLLDHMKKHDGVAYLVTSRHRIVQVRGARIDPNRLFSPEGARRSLERLNPGLSPAAIAKAERFLNAKRGGLLRAILPPRGGLLIAVHNNARGYSVEDEVPISNRVSLPRPDSPHEFFLATDPGDFETLARGPYNCVLQYDARGEDDGSLSRLAARLGVRYVNLEAGIGKRAIQTEMLDWLERNLR